MKLGNKMKVVPMHSDPPLFDVYTQLGVPTKIHSALTLQRAAELIEVDDESFEYCIEEHGRCDGPNWTAIPHLETNPQLFDALTDLEWNPTEPTND